MAIILDIQVHPFLINFVTNLIKTLFPKINLHAKLLGRMKLDYKGELSSCQLSQMSEGKGILSGKASSYLSASSKPHDLLLVYHFLHVSRIRVKLLTFRRLMSYIYGAPILDVSRSHTTTQHSR